MELGGRHLVVTGAGSGIGRALVRRFAAEQPRGLVACDIDGAAAEAVAAEVGCLAVAADVGGEDGVLGVIAAAEAEFGPIDLFCSNAGIGGPEAGPEATNEVWETLWNVNVMAHVWAARALAPRMAARGEGYLLSTASAAGLLMNLGYMPYTVTKHAAVAVAESLATEWWGAGVRVSCLCPQAVATPMLDAAAATAGGRSIISSGAVVSPEQVAEVVVEAIREEHFLILTHPEIGTFVQRRAADHDRWLEGMRRLWTQASAEAAAGSRVEKTVSDYNR